MKSSLGKARKRRERECGDEAHCQLLIADYLTELDERREPTREIPIRPLKGPTADAVVAEAVESIAEPGIDEQAVGDNIDADLAIRFQPDVSLRPEGATAAGGPPREVPAIVPPRTRGANPAVAASARMPRGRRTAFRWGGVMKGFVLSLVPGLVLLLLVSYLLGWR
jgi:hypothetical protein